SAAAVSATGPRGIVSEEVTDTGVDDVPGLSDDLRDVSNGALQVSGHRTASMLSRYNIITAAEIAAVFAQADRYLSTQLTRRNVEEAQFSHSGEVAGDEVLAAQARVGSSGRIRTEEEPPTPNDSNPLDPAVKPIWARSVPAQLSPILTEKRDS